MLCWEEILVYVITYSLLGEGIHSDQFYQDLSAFTDEIVAEIDEHAGQYIEGYRSYLKENGVDEECSKEELGFEFLVLGVLWQVYSGDAATLDTVPKQILTLLAEMREQGSSLKPGIDFLRGILSTIFLSPDLYDHLYVLDTNLVNMNKLINWLEATGEFKHEVLRLSKWQAYLLTLPAKEIPAILTTTIALAMGFMLRSEENLGRYTPNVERYLNELRPDRYWHEDVIFCGRRRVEYHLNMVGAEVMNRAYREAFVKAGKKVIVLPACMRLLPSAKCKADTLRCKRCTTDCKVHQITNFGRKYGFDVYMIPHESSISAGRNNDSFLKQGVGVVGIACALNLLSGGWMLKDRGIPAQCVLLDYCGCNKHWSEEGFPTNINVKQLEKILGIPTTQCDIG